MNYTNKKQSVIFELPLAGYLGQRPIYKMENIYTPEEFKNAGKDNGRVYHDRHGWKSEEEAKAQGYYNKPIRIRNGSEYITTAQQKEEYLFDHDSFSGSIEINDQELGEARDYLKAEGYTAEELDLFKEQLEDDTKRAKADAFDDNYRKQWLEKYLKLTQEHIIDDLDDALSGINYKLIDQLDADDYFKERAEADHLKLEISKANIKQWLKDNDPENDAEKQPENYIDYFADYALDFDQKEIDLEYVDYYGTLGDFDGWLEYFTDYNEITGLIDTYRLDEASKINNLERASLEAKPHLEAIDQYIAKYIDQEPAKTKITRQIKALKSIIKNAV